MLKLVVLADDFTGALDTGVQFSKQGISTLVTTNINYDFEKTAVDSKVLVIDLESRHLTPEQAYQQVINVTRRALKAGIQHIYKKTDSGLRGNIGSELTAIVDANEGESISFIPAFPKAGRTTEKGFHYIDGIPVTQTVFGKDPFEPVKNDHVADIIKEQSSIDTRTVTVNEIDSFSFDEIEKTIVIFDAATDENLEQIARKLAASDMTRAIAGCAGFAEQLPKLLGIDADGSGNFDIAEGFIVGSGSINQVTLEQIDFARQNGFHTINLEPEEKLAEDMMSLPSIHKLVEKIEGIYNREGRIIIEAADSRQTTGAAGSREAVEQTDRYRKKLGLTLEEARQRIADNMGRLIAALVERRTKGTLIVFGGDTLRAVMDTLGCEGIIPLQEIDNGIVFSKAIRGKKMINVISKSGGFGSVDTLLKIEGFIDSMCAAALKEKAI